MQWRRPACRWYDRLYNDRLSNLDKMTMKSQPTRNKQKRFGRPAKTAVTMMATAALLGGWNLIAHLDRAKADLLPPDNPGAAPFKVTFAGGASMFKIGVGDYNADEDHTHLRAWSASDVLLASADYDNPDWKYGGDFMTVSSATPIAYVTFWDGEPYAGAAAMQVERHARARVSLGQGGTDRAGRAGDQDSSGLAVRRRHALASPATTNGGPCRNRRRR